MLNNPHLKASNPFPKPIQGEPREAPHRNDDRHVRLNVVDFATETDSVIVFERQQA